MRKRTYRTIVKNGTTYNMLALPTANFFGIEVVNKYGSSIERYYNEKYGKNVYGISHFIEHLSFRATKDYTTDELTVAIKNEGTYNASTDYDRINYFFETSMEKIDTAINLVCNYSFNTLDSIPENEFLIERGVVFNEAKRYADDDQTMFWSNTVKSLTGYEPEDNVIGIPETIATFEIGDCIAIKDIFLTSGETSFNVTYDSDIMTADEVIEKIESEKARFKPLNVEEKVPYEIYMTNVIQPHRKNAFSANESEQAMTYLNFDVVGKVPTANSGNDYLSQYANGTSLNDLIREKNGLTYGIFFGSDNTSYTPYTYFGCDVSRGNEEKLMKLFKESINLSVDAWDIETHRAYIETKKLKRTMSLLNLKNYKSFHNYATWYPDVIADMKDILSEDIDKAYDIMDKKFSSFEAIKDYIERVRTAVNNDDYCTVTNY